MASKVVLHTIESYELTVYSQRRAANPAVQARRAAHLAGRRLLTPRLAARPLAASRLFFAGAWWPCSAAVLASAPSRARPRAACRRRRRRLR